ncbi:MAG: hypothetical protein HY537_13320 [Deltaproteobacteria bacterium]|nr:hypothetical protein [Deltaproteobacteria bacterium]
MHKRLFLILILTTACRLWADESVQGLYKTILLHEGTKYYQHANITLRTINPGLGQLKISANVKIFFGDSNSNEFLTYEFDDCPMNLLTRQISIKNEKNNIAMVGFLKSGTLDGEWFSTVVGRVGKFVATKAKDPEIPQDGILIKTLTGHYRGSLVNTNPESNLPERMTMSLVSTSDTSGSESVIKISGNVRLYLGDFGSLEYVETKLTDVQFNFFNRYLTAKTADYGLTFKGNMSHEGAFKGVVFADGLGEVATADLKRYPN